MHGAILIVCTGNICRSPMAAGLLGAKLPDTGGFMVASAGISALRAEPAHPIAVELLKDRGIDISAHRGRQVDRATIARHGLVLVMEGVHQQWLTQKFPTACGRVFLIGHWRRRVEVPDPYGQTKAKYEQVLSTLEACVDDWVSRLAMVLGGDIKN